MGYYETRSFCEFFHWRYDPCCIPLRYVVNNCCDCFRRLLWYCFAIVDEKSLEFSTCLTQCTFDLHFQMWEVNEAMCGIDDHTVMSHEVRSYNRSSQILQHNEMLCKNVISNVKYKCGCCSWLL